MKWMVFVPASQRPAILNRTHVDWIWPLSLLPRTINAFQGQPPNPSTWRAIGNWTDAKPIPNRGHWLLRFWPWPYFAFQAKSGWHGRLGFRWDDVDGYWVLSAAIHKFQ